MTPDEQTIRKLRRRFARKVKVATAEGMMLGVTALLKAGDVAVDCGANRGDVTARLAASGAVVHAFEPDPYNFAKLEERFAGIANVRLHAAAVGTETGTIRLMRAANWDSNPESASVKSTVISGGANIAEGVGLDVAIIDFRRFLDDLVAAHGQVAFVKMDIEGAELDLLSAMLDGGHFEHIRLTVAETHEHKFKDLRPRYSALRAAIAEAYPPTRVNLDWI